MELLAGHERFAGWTDAIALLPACVSVRAVPGLDPLPALLTAAVVLSGLLGDSRTDADLLRAVDHFESLLLGEIVTVEDWTDTAEQVIAEVLAWGRAAETAHCLN
jgi:hypothetical protein